MTAPVACSSSACAADVVVLPPRVTPVPRVARERVDQEPAVAPRRDTASFSPEALARLAAERAASAD